VTIGGSGVTISAPILLGALAGTATLDQSNVQTLNTVAFATAAGQTLTAGPGIWTLSGFAGGGDTFVGTAAALDADTIQNWASADTLDLTDMGFATAHLAVTGIAGGGTLAVGDGSHSTDIAFGGAVTSANFVLLGNDGHGGTLIGWYG